MLLKIQGGESLRSYLERNLYLCRDDPEVKEFKNISKFYMRQGTVEMIASALDWDGDSGITRLLQNHTNYPIDNIFCNINDLERCKLERFRSLNSLETGERRAQYCPRCVEDDLEKLGFSYWRRSNRFLKVCAKHNVLLSSECHCGQELYSHHNYGYSTMWGDCKGRLLNQCEALLNENVGELKKSLLYEEILSSNLYICDETAVKMLCAKISCIFAKELVYQEGIQQLLLKLECIAKALDNYSLERRYELSHHDARWMFDAILLSYDSFGKFTDDVQPYVKVAY